MMQQTRHHGGPAAALLTTALLTAATMLTAACQTDDATSPSDGQAGTVILNCNMAGQATRSTTSLQTSSFQNVGETVGVWIQNVRTSAYVESEDGTMTINGQAYTIGNNGYTLSVTKAVPWPSGDAIRTWAVYPSSYISGADFTVQTTQSTASEYTASDLCYSCQQEHAYNSTSTAVSMTFHHMLTKIIVRVTTVGVSDDDITLKLSAKPTTTFTFPIANDAANAVVPGSAKGDLTDITVGLSREDGRLCGAAIIPPQRISQGTDFVAVSLRGGTLTQAVTFEGYKTFEGGKVYTYDITVSSDQFTLSSVTVSDDWGQGGTLTATPGTGS